MQRVRRGVCIRENDDGKIDVSVTLDRRRHKITLGCGTTDSIFIYRQDNDLVILTVNSRLNYCGIEIYDIDSRAVVGETFLQGEQVEEVLGKRGVDRSELAIARILYAHYCEAF